MANEYLKDSLSRRLLKTRMELSLTRIELSRISGTSRHEIKNIEEGVSLRPDSIESIADALKVNPAWLQFGDLWAGRDRRSNSNNR
ncbi:MAG: helix-turn-helix transcriptional regulator [Candidatus Sedimenticola sp. 6PFRAG5]